jgi:hypothetical protein
MLPASRVCWTLSISININPIQTAGNMPVQALSKRSARLFSLLGGFNLTSSIYIEAETAGTNWRLCMSQADAHGSHIVS